MKTSPLVNKVKNVIVGSFSELQGVIARAAFDGGCNVNLEAVSEKTYRLLDWDNRLMANIKISQ